MQKKILIASFVIAAAVITLLVLLRVYRESPEKNKSAPHMVTPLVENENETDSSTMQSYVDENIVTSFIPLNAGETLVTVVSQNLNDDEYEDQAVAVKTISSPYISIIVGLYNTETSQYERTSVIQTNISQVRTFSLETIDLIGDHENALVYQGFEDNGASVLQAFVIERNAGKVIVQNIADLKGDDTVFIQQVDRADAYERMNGNGSSYPIWVYTSDADHPESNDQLQIMYNWSASEKHYVEVSRTRITGTRIEAAELARIQDGTEETFCQFLDGVWYLTTSKAGNRYYIYFNYKENEVIFMNDDEEEVYAWEASHLRRNGIYFTASNMEINSIKRRVDVTLRGVDRVYIRLQDDVRMLITESSSWDGEYKKMSASALLESSIQENPCLDFFKTLQNASSWKSSDGSTISFLGGVYSSIGSDDMMDTGLYTDVVFQNQPFIQFRSDGASPWFSGMYKMSYGSSGKDGKPVKSTVILQPYTLTPESAIASDSRALILTRNDNEQ